MNFAQLMSYFRLKGMITSEQRQSSATDCNGANHEVYMAVVRSDKYSFEYANVMYRKRNGSLALIYADIMYKGISGKADTVSKINAKVSDLKNEFIGYTSDFI